MNDKETIQAAKLLVKKVIDLNYVCDRSNLDDIILERLNDMVEHARSMNCYSGEYVANDDDKSFE